MTVIYRPLEYYHHLDLGLERTGYRDRTAYYCSGMGGNVRFESFAFSAPTDDRDATMIDQGLKEPIMDSLFFRYYLRSDPLPHTADINLSRYNLSDGLDLGLLIKDEDLELFVYNNYSIPMDVTKIEGINDPAMLEIGDVIDVDDVIPPYGMVHSKYRILKDSDQIILDIRGYFTFKADIDSTEQQRDFIVKGLRIDVFDYEPDGTSVIDSYDLKMVVNRFIEGNEAAHTVATKSLRSIEYSITVADAMVAAKMRDILRDRLSKVWVVPMYVDEMRITAVSPLEIGIAPLAATGEGIPESWGSSTLVLLKDKETSEIVKLERLPTDSRLVFNAPLTHDWKVGSRVLELRKGRLSPPFNLESLPYNVYRITFNIMLLPEPADSGIKNVGSFVLLDGDFPYIDIATTNESYDMAFDYDLSIKESDAGYRVGYPIYTRPFETFDVTYYDTRDKIYNLLDVFTQRGVEGTVYILDPTEHWRLLHTVRVGEREFYFLYSDSYYSYQRQLPFYLKVRDRDNISYHKVIAVRLDSSSNIVATVESPIEKTIDATTSPIVSLLFQARINQSNLNIEWITSDLARTVVNFKRLQN